jgi:thioredoxin 1
MKKNIISLSILAMLCAGTFPLVADQTSQEIPLVATSVVTEDLRFILKKTFLNSNAEPFLNMIATEAIRESGKTMDAEDLIAKFKDAFNGDDTMAKLAGPYKELFSDSEIHELKLIHESPTFEKYTHQANQVFQANFMTIQDTLKELAVKHGEEPKAEEEVASNIIEVTQENFDEVIANATKPIIIDVYSTSCGPCRMMDPVLKELSGQYKDTVQFVKINCDTQPELAKKYGVTQLPTLLFVKPGEDAVALKATGYTSKKDLNDKIVEFVR